jgi:hypothetical protein
MDTADGKLLEKPVSKVDKILMRKLTMKWDYMQTDFSLLLLNKCKDRKTRKSNSSYKVLLIQLLLKASKLNQIHHTGDQKFLFREPTNGEKEYICYLSLIESCNLSSKRSMNIKKEIAKAKILKFSDFINQETIC